MTDWSKKYNELPYETRHIAAMVSCQDQINGLLREKARLKTRYKQSLNEINEHIKSCLSDLEREGK